MCDITSKNLMLLSTTIMCNFRGLLFKIAILSNVIVFFVNCFLYYNLCVNKINACMTKDDIVFEQDLILHGSRHGLIQRSIVPSSIHA